MSEKAGEEQEVDGGYCITRSGQIYIWIEGWPDSRWPFVIMDDEQVWDGGFGIDEWTLIQSDDPRITKEVKEQLGLECVLEQARDRLYEEQQFRQRQEAMESSHRHEEE
jgi:hypothetical protein